MGKDKRQKPEETDVEEEEHLSLFKKVLTRDSEFTSDEWKSVSHWFKQIVALLLGVIWGVLPILGALGVILFAHKPFYCE